MLNRRNVLEGRSGEAVALAANGADQIKAIPWPSIRTDGGTQMRVGMSQATIDRYAEDMGNGDAFPALIVYLDSRGSYWLADGFHRYQAHRQAFGVDKPILCKVESGEKRDAVLYAARANSKHGLPRTPEDKRYAVDTLLKDLDWSKWSDREIARACAVSNTFVGERRKLLTVNVDSEKTYTTKHGTVATMRTNGIGKRQTPPTEPQPPAPAPLTLDETKAVIWRVLRKDGPAQSANATADACREWLYERVASSYIRAIVPDRTVDDVTFSRAFYAVCDELGGIFKPAIPAPKPAAPQSAKPSVTREERINAAIDVFGAALRSLQAYGELTGKFSDVPAAERVLRKLIDGLKENLTQ